MKVTALETSESRRGVRPEDELVVARAERDLWLVRLRQTEAARDNLRTDLAEALAQIEYWRTLAEYRERRLVERQDSSDGKGEARPVRALRGGDGT